jgi:hypothetical protein
MAKAKWTVMVLMGANNVGDETDLSDYAESDLQEMEKISARDEQSVLNILVQTDQKAGPQRYIITRAGRQPPQQVDELLLPGEGGSDDTDVLKNFLIWAKRYPADHYLLVLWGHAYRLAFNRDPNNPDGTDFRKLSEVLRSNSEDGWKLDIVAFDSCNVSLIEFAYQLRGAAHYMVASQFTDPLPGWPYDDILERVLVDRKNLTGKDGPRDFGRAIVSFFVRSYVGTENATMTMLDLHRVGDIAKNVEGLARELLLAVDADEGELDVVLDGLERSQVPVEQPSVDLISFCSHLLNYSGNLKLRTAASALGDLLLKPTDPFIVAHERSDLVVAMLQGVSAFAPSVKSGFDSISLRPRYEELDLAKDTLWGDLVFALAEPDA